MNATADADGASQEACLEQQSFRHACLDCYIDLYSRMRPQRSM